MSASSEIERFWSEQASRFDDEPDHGLGDPIVRAAWASRLAGWIPSVRQDVADLGCGTGSLSLLLAQHGHAVTGIDLSPRMIELAVEKCTAAGVNASFIVGDAGAPALPSAAFDVVLCRHLLWTLPDPQGALERWTRVLRPGGRLVAIEGRWFEPGTDERERDLRWDGGVPSEALIAVVTPLFEQVEHFPLSEADELWGRRVSDERYAIVATLAG